MLRLPPPLLLLCYRHAVMDLGLPADMRVMQSCVALHSRASQPQHASQAGSFVWHAPRWL